MGSGEREAHRPFSLVMEWGVIMHSSFTTWPFIHASILHGKSHVELSQSVDQLKRFSKVNSFTCGLFFNFHSWFLDFSFFTPPIITSNWALISCRISTSFWFSNIWTCKTIRVSSFASPWKTDWVHFLWMMMKAEPFPAHWSVAFSGWMSSWWAERQSLWEHSDCS